jgi:hypothetical protein
MRLFSLIITGVLSVSGLAAQKSIFGLHAVAGFNASQIRGDELAGFDKVGLTAGLRSTVELKGNAGLSVEMLYSERGSRPNIFGDVVDPDINVTLRYLDLPVYFTYADWEDAENGYDKAHAALGFSYGRLIEYSTFDHFNPEDKSLDVLSQYFNKNDISWLIGFGIRLSPHFAINARYTRSITLLLNAPKKDLQTNSLRVFFLSFRGEYIF